jgi:hypothetical protein
MVDEEGFELYVFEPRVVEGEELSDITEILAREMGDYYYLAPEATMPSPSREVLVPRIDLAQSWDDLVARVKLLAPKLTCMPDFARMPAYELSPDVELRLYPVRTESMEPTDRSLVVIVDWTHGEVLGFG